MKKQIKGLSLLIAAMMVAAIATPVFAQSETDPLEDPAPVVEVSSFVDHPIVKLLAGFFANLFAPPVVELPDGQVIVLPNLRANLLPEKNHRMRLSIRSRSRSPRSCLKRLSPRCMKKRTWVLVK